MIKKTITLFYCIHAHCPHFATSYNNEGCQYGCKVAKFESIEIEVPVEQVSLDNWIKTIKEKYPHGGY